MPFSVADTTATRLLNPLDLKAAAIDREGGLRASIPCGMVVWWIDFVSNFMTRSLLMDEWVNNSVVSSNGLADESRTSPPVTLMSQWGVSILVAQSSWNASDKQHASLLSLARLQRASSLGQHVRVHDIARYSTVSVLRIHNKHYLDLPGM